MERIFLQETCSICDANYYSLPSTDKSNTFTKTLVEGGTNPSVSFNTDHYTANYGSKTTMILFPCELPTNCLISVKLKRSSNSYMGLGVSKGTGYANVFLIGGNKLYEHHYSNSSYGGSGGNVNCSYTSGYNEFVIEKTGQSAKVKINGTTYMTKTLQFSNSDTLYPGIALDNASVCDFKEILIKPL